MHAAILSILFSLGLVLQPFAAHSETATQCSIDKAVSDGGLVYEKCPSSSDDNALIEAGFNGARLEPNITQSSTPIWVHEVCAYVDAAGSHDALFIPFNTAEEWYAFLNNSPSGVNLANCCVPRSITVADVKRPAKSCSGNSKWVLLGLVNSNTHEDFLARPLSNDADSELMESYFCPTCKNKKGVRAMQLPVARDDIGATAPASNGVYTASWICGNQAPQYVDFRVQCNDGEWGDEAVAAQCEETDVEATKSCPNGQTGSITVHTSHVCDGSNNGAGRKVVTEEKNCKAKPTKPEPSKDKTCVPFQNKITQKPCPAGYTGTIYVYTSHYCDGKNNGAGTEDVSENDQCSKIPETKTATSCVAFQNKITQKACPAGSTGTIYVYTSHYCDGSNGGKGKDEVSENNQCSKIPETKTTTDCVAFQNKITQKACPAGSTGTIYVYTSHYCDGSNGGKGKDEVSENNQCSKIPETKTTTDCVAFQNKITQKSCPAGSTGTIYVYTSHYCDGSNDGKGKDEVSENNQCTLIQTPKPNNDTCVYTESVTQKACPSNSTGTIYVYKSHYCDGSNGGKGRDQISENNQCTLKPTTTPNTNTCVTSESVTTRACPSGYSGTIYVYKSHYCDGSNGGRGRDQISENNQCGLITVPTYYPDPYYEDPLYVDDEDEPYYYDDVEEPAYDEPDYDYSYDDYDYGYDE